MITETQIPRFGSQIFLITIYTTLNASKKAPFVVPKDGRSSSLSLRIVESDVVSTQQVCPFIYEHGKIASRYAPIRYKTATLLIRRGLIGETNPVLQYCMDEAL